MDARDYIAVIVLIGGFTLLALGIDSLVEGILIAVVSFNFGVGYREPEKRRKI